MMWGATRCTLFHTEFGVMSGPGADDGDERARALLISSVSRAWQSAKGRRMVSLGPGGSPGKKWSRSALLSSSGVLAPGKEIGGEAPPYIEGNPSTAFAAPLIPQYESHIRVTKETIQFVVNLTKEIPHSNHVTKERTPKLSQHVSHQGTVRVTVCRNPFQRTVRQLINVLGARTSRKDSQGKVTLP